MQYPAHAYSAKTITCAEFGWICIVHNHRNHADTIISQSAYPRFFVVSGAPVGLEPMTIGQTDESAPIIPDPACLLLLYVMTTAVRIRISHKA